MPAVLPREYYNNDLRKTTCTEEEYEAIKDLASKIGIGNFTQLHNCYLWTDVLALADVVERYSIDWRGLRGLDPLHSLTAPSASYTAMLRAVGPRFELPTKTTVGWPLWSELTVR